MFCSILYSLKLWPVLFYVLPVSGGTEAIEMPLDKKVADSRKRYPTNRIQAWSQSNGEPEKSLSNAREKMRARVGK